MSVSSFAQFSKGKPRYSNKKQLLRSSRLSRRDARIVLISTCPDLLLREAGVHGDLLPHAHVGVPVPLEQRLELLQLLRREVRPLPPLPLVLVLLRLGIQLRVRVLVGALLLLLARVRLWNRGIFPIILTSLFFLIYLAG